MSNITVTDKAWEKIKELTGGKQTDTGEKLGLRIKVVGGGCSGLSYKLEFDTLRHGDIKTEKTDLFVVVDPKSLLYVKGTELDYEDNLIQSGFVLRNPNIKHSCGCGQSFTT